MLLDPYLTSPLLAEEKYSGATFCVVLYYMLAGRGGENISSLESLIMIVPPYLFSTPLCQERCNIFTAAKLDSESFAAWKTHMHISVLK